MSTRLVPVIDATEATQQIAYADESGVLTPLAQLVGPAADSLQKRGVGTVRYLVNAEEVPSSTTLTAIDTSSPCVIEHLEVVVGSDQGVRLLFSPRDAAGTPDVYVPLRVDGTASGTGDTTVARLLQNGSLLWRFLHQDEELHRYKLELRTPFAMPAGFRFELANISGATQVVSLMAFVRNL